MYRRAFCVVFIWLVMARQNHNPLLAEDLMLFDFEKRTLREDWSAVRLGIEVSREPMPAGQFANQFEPRGRGVTVRSNGRSGLFCRSKRVPRDWTTFDRFSFWVFRQPGEKTSTVEIRMYEPDGKTWYWRKVELGHEGWKEITVPLPWFRWSDGRIPNWRNIDRVGFWFRDPAKLSIDSIHVTKSSLPRGNFLTAQTLAQVAFPSGREAVRREQRNEVEVLTNAPPLNLDQLANSLSHSVQQFSRDFPSLGKPSHPPLLIVFADRQQYRQFTVRLGAQLGATAPPPSSDGYSLQGVATSYWDERRGTKRPVYTHELIHSLLARTLRIRSRGGWFHEGLASLYQLRAYPQDDVPRMVRRGIAQENAHLPLQTLCSGDRIPNSRYWQAATTIEMMLATDKYRSRLAELLAMFRRQGTTNLGPALEPIFGTTWDQLTADWKDFCRQRYAS